MQWIKQSLMASILVILDFWKNLKNPKTGDEVAQQGVKSAMRLSIKQA